MNIKRYRHLWLNYEIEIASNGLATLKAVSHRYRRVFWQSSVWRERLGELLSENDLSFNDFREITEV